MSDTNRNRHLLDLQEKWVKLSNSNVKGLFIYYGALIICSMIVSSMLLACYTSQSEDVIPLSKVLLQSFICGLLGSSIYYYRKLYKSCIQLLVDSNYGKGDVSSMGVKAYFIGRPIIGAVISVIAILIIYSGLFFLVDAPTIIHDKFFIFIFILAFLFGFSNGNLINRLDKSKDNIADKVDFSKGGK